MDPARLWHGRAVKAAVSASDDRIAGFERAVSRPHRQGHPRRAARRDDRRRDSARASWAGVRAAAVDGYGGRVHRSARRDRADDLVPQRYSRGILGSGHPGVPVVRLRLGDATGDERPDDAQDQDEVGRVPRPRSGGQAADRGGFSVRAGALFGELPDSQGDRCRDRTKLVADRACPFQPRLSPPGLSRGNRK